MGFRHYLRQGTRTRLIAGERVNWISNRPAGTARYIAAVVMSMPPWLTLDDKRDINLLDAWARCMEIMTGEFHNLDHIVPLRHPLVCGLTVPWNLQVITFRQNMAKSNDFNPEQGDLFGEMVNGLFTPTCGHDAWLRSSSPRTTAPVGSGDGPPA